MHKSRNLTRATRCLRSLVPLRAAFKILAIFQFFFPPFPLLEPRRINPPSDSRSGRRRRFETRQTQCLSKVPYTCCCHVRGECESLFRFNFSLGCFVPSRLYFLPFFQSFQFTNNSDDLGGQYAYTEHEYKIESVLYPKKLATAIGAYV